MSRRIAFMAVPEILFMLLLSSPATAAEPFPVAAAGCLEPLNPGEPLPHLRVRAALRTGDGEVVAETILRLTNGSRVPLEELPLLFPAALFHHPEEDLDDRNFPWRYPGGVSTALCQVVSARVLEGDPGIAEGAEGPCRAVHHLHLTRPLEPGATLTLSLTTRIRPPRRFGTFGVARGMVTLRGGWHPVLPSLEGAGFRIDAGPGPSVVDAEVCPDERTQILLGPVLGPATPGLPAAWSGTLHEPLLLAAAPDLRRTAIQEGTRRVDLVHRSRDPGPGDTEAPGELLQWDWPAEREAGIRRVLRGLLDPFDGLAWTVLVAPLGEALAVPGRETVVISDALYQITDVDLLRRYHDEALAATLLAASQRGQQPLVHPYLALLTGLLIRQRV
ncbi:MAG: hypothetical protein FJ098_06640, partial [Deltaproteobacteria bacterium]|nr:hypothetical protein [Deltaproteobacteria bacterium]